MLYHMIQNFGGRKFWQIRQIPSHSAKFFVQKFSFKKLIIGSMQHIYVATHGEVFQVENCS